MGKGATGPRGRIRQWEVLPLIDHQKLVLELRKQHGKCRNCGAGLEYSIQGLPAISEWLHQMGYFRVPVKPHTLMKYVKRFALPIIRSPRTGGGGRIFRWSPPWTTNLLLHAWMTNQGRIPSLPPWHQNYAGPMRPRPRAWKNPRDRRPIRTPDAKAAPSGPILGSF